MSRRRLFGWLALGLAVGALMSSTSSARPLTFRAEGLTYPVPASGLTRAAVADWAARLGVSADLLTVAIVVHSERGSDPRHAVEAGYIAHTILNRARLGRPFGGPSIWGVAVTESTTGTQGGRRQYASSRPPQGQATAYALGVAHQAWEAQRSGENARWITHFHHLPAGERRNALEARRLEQGYEVVALPGIAAGSIVRFLAPTRSKLQALLGAVA